MDDRRCRALTLALASEEFDLELPMEPAPLEYFVEKWNHYKDRSPNPNRNNAEYIINGGYEKLTDSCAYLVDDEVLEEGGYEPTCHLEYCLKGPLKKGVTRLYADSFRAVFEKLHGKL